MASPTRTPTSTSHIAPIDWSSSRGCGIRTSTESKNQTRACLAVRKNSLLRRGMTGGQNTRLTAKRSTFVSARSGFWGGLCLRPRRSQRVPVDQLLGANRRSPGLVSRWVQDRLRFEGGGSVTHLRHLLDARSSHEAYKRSRYHAVLVERRGVDLLHGRLCWPGEGSLEDSRRRRWGGLRCRRRNTGQRVDYDGRFLYYWKNAGSRSAPDGSGGIWRMPIKGGKEEFSWMG